MRAQRRWPYLVGAALLLAAAGYFMSRGDAPEKPSPVETMHFPTRLRGDEYQRMEKRQTLLVKLAGEGPKQPVQLHDPLMAALPAGGPGKTAVVIEANALRNSPIGELLLDCMRTKHGGGDPLAPFRDKTHIDLLTDVDRVAVTDDGTIVTGNFKNADWDQIPLFKEASQSPYGDHAVMYTPSGASDRPFPPGVGAMAVWNGEMVITGATEAQVEASIDRLEGRAPPVQPAIDEGDSYGDVYGTLSPADLAKMLGTTGPSGAMAQKILDAAQQVKLHIDAQGDVDMVADVEGPDADKVTDLGKALGGALSLGRIEAQAKGDGDLADLLDLARIQPDGDKFEAKLALPMSMLQKKLAWCRAALDGGSAQPPPAP